MELNNDEYEHVKYECSECGKVDTITDTNLARIEAEFMFRGWTNTPVIISETKTDYIVLCPDCVAIGQLADDMEDKNETAHWAQFGHL